MTELNSILMRFEPISLQEMDGVRLMNRTDTKFMIGREQLEQLLLSLDVNYRVLEVEGMRINRYKTLYFDTLDFLCYRQHHSGKRNRFKIRKREYVESHISYLEYKEKTNKGRTIKSRIKLGEIGDTLNDRENAFIDERTQRHLSYEPKLWNRFGRITLVDTVAGERLTIDTDITFDMGDRRAGIPELVIIEVKRDENSGVSEVLRQLKHQLVRPESMSKYCLGVALLYPEMKSNNFKQKLLKIEKIKLSYVA
jgi:hypothetical protein